MKKIGLICLALVLAVGAIGFGYAHWYDQVYIDATVESGHFEIIFTDAMSNDPPVDVDTCLDPKEAGNWTLDTTLSWAGDRYLKDVGSLEVTGAGTTELIVTLDNGYPAYYPSVGFTIDNPGTIPAKIESIKINGVDCTCPVNMDFDGDGNVDVEIAVTHIDVGQQIDAGGEQLGDLDLRIYEQAAMQASECVSGGFTVSIVATQYNKVAAKTISVPSAGIGTIQAAVDAASPGDTVYIAAGAYIENVLINKAVTLRGAGPGVCKVTALNSGIPVFDVTADGVTISGFTITSGFRGINLEGVDDCSICSNDLLDNTIAIYLKPGSDNNVIENNYISTTTYDGIWLLSADNNLIKGNTCQSSATLGQMIYLDGCSDCEVIANTCSMANGGSGIRLVGNWDAGIGGYPAWGNNIIRGNICYDMTIGISLNNGSNNTIEANVCTNIGNAIRLDASYGGTSSGNMVKGNRLVNGWSAAIASINWCWDPAFFDPDPGFFSDITITENQIFNNRAGIYLGRGDTTNWPVDATAFTIVNNNICGNELYGVKNLGSGVLDAESNWWGSVNGPEDPDETVEVPPCTADPASEKNEEPAGELGNMVVDTDTIVVDYCPWLSTPY